MNILMVSAENGALPNGKVGGIGDVIRDVPIELAKQQHHVSVITPGYGLHSQQNKSALNATLSVNFAGKQETVFLYKLTELSTQHITQWVLEHDLFATGGVGKIYCDDGNDRPFASDASKFALFCAAVCELINSQWLDQLDVIHLHDWHAAIIAVLRQFAPQYQSLQQIKLVYTIHNLALQGIRPFNGDQSSVHHWFPMLEYNPDEIADPRYSNCFNPTRAGINLSDAVHVVSPTYAKEVLLPSDSSQGFFGGEGLELDLQNAASQNRLFGILNGCDYSEKNTKRIKKSDLYAQLLTDIENILLQWSAKTVTVQSCHFIASKRLEQWKKSKITGPLLTSVGRLTSQKVTLLLSKLNNQLVLEHLLTNLANYNGRLLLLGSGDKELEHDMTTVMAQHDNFIYLNGYGENLSDAIYSCGDLFLMPSSFEPCGISQMVAMRAGQPCLVHEIGGLKDTIDKGIDGFSFSGANVEQQCQQLLIECDHALDMFKSNKPQWNKIKAAAKKKRFLWSTVIENYINQLYCSK